MPSVKDRSRERRWIVLATDGRYSTLGRASDPTDEEVCQVEYQLRAQGLAGWLAVMEGNPYVGRIPRLMEVRSLADPDIPFADAAAACIRSIEESRATNVA